MLVESGDVIYSRMSFRDPGGSLHIRDGRIFRFVTSPEAASTATELLESSLGRNLMSSGRLVNTRLVLQAPRTSVEGITLEHDPVWFPSFASEWSPDMLYSAAELTLDLLEEALSSGYTLKDATPHNVLFHGTSPIFVDFLSIERRDPRNPHWLPLGQFTRTFLLPLLAHREFGLSPSMAFLPFRDGLEPEQILRFCTPVQRLKPLIWRFATLPSLLSGMAEKLGDSIYKPHLVEPDRANFTLRSLVRRLRKLLVSVRPRLGQSNWTDYNSLTHVQQSEAHKEAFVLNVLHQDQCKAVLDIGCNTGHYSLVAARAGASVVAIDSDEAVISRLFRETASAQLDVQPLVVNIGRPTPSVGWLNVEQASFIARSENKFDCVLMLDILHHLLVSERIPLDQIIKFVAQTTTNCAVISFVPTSDPMFRKIARGRDHLHAGLTREKFEAETAPYFDCIQKSGVPGGDRTLYWLRKKKSTEN